MKFLEYSFFRIYQFQLWVGNHVTPIGTSVIGFTALVMFNLFSLINLLGYYTGIHILFFNDSKTTALLFFLFILLIVCYLFLYRKKYNLIIEKYKHENKRQRRKGNLYVLLVLLFTLGLVYFSLYLMYLKNIS